MEPKHITGVIIGGILLGFTFGAGFILAQKLFKGRQVAVVPQVPTPLSNFSGNQWNSDTSLTEEVVSTFDDQRNWTARASGVDTWNPPVSHTNFDFTTGEYR